MVIQQKKKRPEVTSEGGLYQSDSGKNPDSSRMSLPSQIQFLIPVIQWHEEHKNALLGALALERKEWMLCYSSCRFFKTKSGETWNSSQGPAPYLQT